MLKLKLQYRNQSLATWCKELTHWKRPCCWERLKAGGEEDDRDCWMVSPTRWTWVWANSKRRWNLAHCSSWGRKESDVTQWLNNNRYIYIMDFSLLFLVTKWCLTLLQLHGIEPSRLLCPWDFPGKSTRVGCISFSKGSSQTWDQTHISCVGRQILYHWAQLSSYLRL